MIGTITYFLDYFGMVQECSGSNEGDTSEAPGASWGFMVRVLERRRMLSDHSGINYVRFL